MERQLKYRELIPMTYEQYLDEPWDVIEWTLQIHELRAEAHAAAQRRQKAGPSHDAGAS